MTTLTRNLAVCTLLFAGCSFGPVGLRTELGNKGLLAVSEQNPYVAANQLLAMEVAKSEVLRGFVEKEGAPDAIEIQTSWFEDDEAIFYYLDRAQGYHMTSHETSWIIRGPEPLSDEFLAKVKHFPQIHGKAALGVELVQEKPTSTPESVKSDAPKLKQLRKVKKSKPPVQPANVEPKRETTAVQPTSSAAGADPTSKAEATFSGDIIHPVSYSGETLRTISEWYTGDPENAARIAGINDLADPNTLSLGKTIRIPRYLLKRTDPMPASAVKETPKPESN